MRLDDHVAVAAACSMSSIKADDLAQQLVGAWLVL
jgi:hypothetical protein